MSKEEAIEILNQYDVNFEPCPAEDVMIAIDMAIEALEQKPEWISVSERLPENDVEVFVYLFNRPSPYIAWLNGCRWHTEDFEVEQDDEPIAWMPLPKPWEEEK